MRRRATPKPPRRSRTIATTRHPPEKERPPAPQGVWSDLPNFPTVSLGFSNDPNANGPLRLKRAGAAVYYPTGKIYILGGRHRVDGDDIGSRWIWEYTPGNPGTLTQKAALLDENNFGSRFVANMAVATLTDTLFVLDRGTGAITLRVPLGTTNMLKPRLRRASRLVRVNTRP